MSFISDNKTLVGSISGKESLIGKLSSNQTLKGSVSSESTLSGTISSSSCLSGKISTNESLIGTLHIQTIVSNEYETYNGAYTIVPKANEAQTMQTRNKIMTADVTVKKIPYFETTNTDGGLTVYIGSEV